VLSGLKEIGSGGARVPGSNGMEMLTTHIPYGGEDTMAIDNERGSAVAIVLMFLGVLSLVGAGLILQTRLDVQFTRASESASSMIALADGASSKAVKNMPANPPMEASGADPIASEVTDTKVVQGSGQYQYRHVYVAKAPSGAIKGFEVSGGGYGGGGYYPAYWLTEGYGWQLSRPDKKKQVRIPTLQAHKE
jgi:hypothetical protein